MKNRETTVTRNSRKLFGWLIRYDPADMYGMLDRPPLAKIADAASEFVADAPGCPLPPKHQMRERRIPIGVLWETLNDVTQFTQRIVETQNPEVRDLAHRRRDISLVALARVAQTGNANVVSYHEALTRLDEAGQLTVSAVMSEPGYPSHFAEAQPYHQCPFAQPSHGSDRDPLFDRFISWSTDLSLLTYANTTSPSAQLSTDLPRKWQHF